MAFKCKINGVEYPIIEGFTQSEEYNETLDSASVIIPQLESKINIKPYDDVFLINSDNGYEKHFLIDNFTLEELNISNTKRYEYKIQLFSEIKALEKVILPNLSITQPVNTSMRRSVWFYLNAYVELYSPKIKVATGISVSWAYTQKYRFVQTRTGDDNRPTPQQFFNKVDAPEISFTNPSLRDVLTQLMLVKNCIPIIKDDRIDYLEIGKDTGITFDIFSENAKKHLSYMHFSMTSENYATNFRREYSGAISQENTSRCVEHIGFRNSKSDTLTLDNLQLETRFPIYKINKIYACYYKKVYLVGGQSNTFMCKQDITPLVLQNVVRNAVNNNYYDYISGVSSVNTVEDLSKYKFTTLGYDIGSNIISGWSEKHDYIKNDFWNLLWGQTESHTTIENIIEFMDKTYPFGVNSYEIAKINDTDVIDLTRVEQGFNAIQDFDVFNGFTSVPQKTKALMFEVDYISLQDNTIIHSKDIMRDDITSPDNCSSSLTILEVDGLLEKEKINRLGNNICTISGRYNSLGELDTLGHNIGSFFEYENEKYIVYHREVSTYKNYIIATFLATPNYVLRNYFTSVWAKYRTYNLMSYGESIKRAENERAYLYMSLDKLYYESNKKSLISRLCSCFVPTAIPEVVDDFKYPDRINFSYFQITSYTPYQLCDFTAFHSGNILCVNARTYDNVTGGVYIDRPRAFAQGGSNVLIGSGQKWSFPNNFNVKNPFVDYFVFTFGNVDFQTLHKERASQDSDNNYKTLLENNIIKFPQSSQPYSNLGDITNFSHRINKYIYKDSKEYLDFTFQVEPITDTKNIVLSSWFTKLSDLICTQNKYDESGEIVNPYGTLINATLYFYTYHDLQNTGAVVLRVPKGTTFQDIYYFFSKDAESNQYNALDEIEHYGEYVYFTLTKIKKSTSNVIIGFKNYAYKNDLISNTYEKEWILEKVNTSDSTYDYYRFLYMSVDSAPNISNGKTGSNDVTLLDNTNSYVKNITITEVATDIYQKYTKLQTYTKNMFVVSSNNFVDNIDTQKSYTIDNLTNEGLTLYENIMASNVFKYEERGGIPIISVNQNGIIAPNYQSLQYWFSDDKGYYHFVFGVNTTGSAIILLSWLTKKDERVYDSTHKNVIGKIANYNAYEQILPYGAGTYYDIEE